ncbi:AMIN-like domain-containing (lipo)protein [Scrofimicrobium canadense]|uniref:AMIN-like domain-containing (lipo)protein n=1 Tax=Scrofimicrobium canadense TaxID=2652290 RepID=UPI001CEC33BA|nr:hypothetical protein [Scrofimicrobium canadense]
MNRKCSTGGRLPLFQGAVALLASTLLFAGCSIEQGTVSPSSDSPVQSDDTSVHSAPQSLPQSDKVHPSREAQSSDMQRSESVSPINGDTWLAEEQSRKPAVSSDTEGLIFHDLRLAEHDGFYRVVVEFAGEDTPGWFVRWVDQPVEQGRGLPLDISGKAFLDVNVTGTMMPIMEGQLEKYYSGPNSLMISPIEVVQNGTFEDQTHIAIGMDKEREFQIGLLDAPARVVIDIKK